jgi:glycosyltransferase involved in cell wall biosynthesis
MNPIKPATKNRVRINLQVNDHNMEKSQVLIISFWNPTDKYPQQGIFIQEQVSAVCKLRENVIFLQVNVLPSKGLFLKKTIRESAPDNYKLITINLYSFLWKFWYVDPRALARVIYRFIRRSDEIKPAIIHSNVIFPCGIVGYLLSRKLHTRLLISEHWSKTGKFMRHPLYRRIALRAYRESYAIACVSRFLSGSIEAITGHPNIVIIPNIIDTSIFTFRPKPKSQNGSLSMLCVASWRLPKRLDLIFDSLCSFAADTELKIGLTVVGTGPQAEMLSKKKTPGNLTVKWAGYLDRQSIASLLHGTHIFLHASDIETFSVVTAEALSTGTPVLASDTGALPELINEKNGMLVENRPEAWLEGLRNIVGKQYDYQSIALLNQDKFSSLNVGKSIISLYDQIDEDLN